MLAVLPSSSLKRPIDTCDACELHSHGLLPKKRKTSDSSLALLPNIGPTPAHSVNSDGSVAQFAIQLSDEQKNLTLRYMLNHSLTNPSLVSASALVTVACEHSLKRKRRNLIIADLQAHSCAWSCLVRSSDASEAGQLCIDVDLPPVTRSPKPRPNDAPRRQRHRKQLAAIKTHSSEDDLNFWAKSWPQLESEESLKQIMTEHRSQTTSHALLRKPCSFCNRNQLVNSLKIWNVGDLDITLLESAARTLRVHYNQPKIQSHSTHDGRYQACPTCARCVRGRKFFKLPLYSWANGCWIGKIPPELASLTYAEELVVARAHTTKCWAKLNAGSGPRILKQRAASGNVCIHPHEITILATTLPRPMSTLYDEIVVIFVSEDQEATPEMFKQIPFLVRRGHLLRALNWLKANNPLYSDVVIDLNALAEYPSDDDGHVPFPIQHQYANDTIRGQNATYTGHGIDTTEAIFAEYTGTEGQIPISVTGTFDVDNIEKITE
ncbi:hypothetical protein C8F04DRAFT_1244704 [Mycena alexandri]|uniref:DUF6570 domain-containing protein n=2 Tax=Mycena alexandri TaxID=1745969 RepID=A0AAD6RX07_9AGAR|nr:hypothetical protein C8F04DRAFT_1244704 [Mycena alexandri]